MCYIIDDDAADVPDDAFPFDVVEQGVIFVHVMGIGMVEGEYFEVFGIVAFFLYVVVSWHELVFGVLEVEVQYSLVSLDDFGRDVHGKNGLTDVWFAEETCHFALVPEPLPQVNRWLCVFDDSSQDFGLENFFFFVLYIKFFIWVVSEFLGSSELEEVGDGVFLFSSGHVGIDFGFLRKDRGVEIG